MALSGNYHDYPVSSFGVYVEWSATQSVKGNYSDVTQKVYLSYYTIEVGARDDGTSSINGTEVTYSSAAIKDYSSGWKKKLLYTHTVRVYHNASGVAANIPLSASWRFSGTYSSTYVGRITASTTVTLNSIDRAAPTVTLTTSNITASGVTVNATASTTCDRWDYSTDNGSTWVNFSTSSGTTQSKAITGLTPNTTYNIKVRARKSSNEVYGASAAASVKTLGGSVISSVNTFTADNSTAQITMSVTVYNTSYTHTLVLKNGSTTVLTITSLSLSNGSNTITLTSAQRSTVLSAMSSIKSFTGTFELKTYSGGTQIGTASTKTATVQTTAANSAPTFTGFTYQDTNATAVAVTSNNKILIQGVSTLAIAAVAATAKNGASISSYSAVAGSKTASSTTTSISVGTISDSGTVAVIVTAIDSRGYTTSVTVNITVIAYEAIDLTNYSARRENEVEDTIQAAISGAMKPVTISGVNKNSLKYVRYRYKKTSDGSYGSWVNVTSSATSTDTSFSYSNNELVDLDSDYSYYIEFRVDDQLTHDSVIITIPQGTPLMSFRRQKVGINQRSPAEALDVNGNIKMNGYMVQGLVGDVDENTDLNSLTTSGIYFACSDTTDNHAPTTDRGVLEVVQVASFFWLQRYTTLTGAKMYVRTKYNSSTWGAWKSTTLS